MALILLWKSTALFTLFLHINKHKIMQTYVVSLPSAKKRREHITQIFDMQNIPFLFFDAISPSEALNKAISELVPSLKYQSFLSEIEKACFMSHVILWKQAIDEGLPYIAILEDDVLLGSNADKFLTEDTWLNERMPANSAFIVRLETLLIPINIKPSNITAYQDRQFPLLDSPHGGTAGYIISQKAIRLIMENLFTLPAEEIQPIDMMIFGTYLGKKDISVYQINPGICVQELNFSQDKNENSILGSMLEEQRRKNQEEYRKKHKKHRSFKQRLLRALTKISREKRKREQIVIPFR